MFGEALTRHRSVPALAGLIVCMAGCCLLRHVWRVAPLRVLPCAVGFMRHVQRRLHSPELTCMPWALPLPPTLHPGDKYVVRMVEDPEAALDEPMRSSGGDSGTAPEPRVQFEILPASSAQPVATKGWQRVAAGVLLLLTLGSTLQFGLAANIGLLPKVRVGGGCEHGAQVVQVLWCCAAALRTLACMQGLLVQQCCLFLLGSLLAQEPYSAALRTVWRSG